MAGGFPVSYQFAPFAGSVPTGAHGISVTPSATANTLGSWVEIITSTGYDSSWLMVSLQDSGSATALNTVAINVGTGAAGSEAVLIANLVSQRDSLSSVAGEGATYLLPVQITSGTRLSANSQSSGSGSAAVFVSMIPIAGSFACISYGSAIDTYGFSASATKGIVIDPGGTASTKGAYSEIISSAPYDMAGFALGFDATTQSGAAALGWTIDVALGASGSEVVILPDFQLYGRGTGTTYKAIYPSSTPFIPIQIPAGSRVAARAQCSSTSAPPRVIGVTFYGVRL